MGLMVNRIDEQGFWVLEIERGVKGTKLFMIKGYKLDEIRVIIFKNVEGCRISIDDTLMLGKGSRELGTGNLRAMETED